MRSGPARPPVSYCRRSRHPVCLHRWRRSSTRRMRARSPHALVRTRDPCPCARAHVQTHRLRRVVWGCGIENRAQQSRRVQMPEWVWSASEPADDVQVLPDGLVAPQEDAFRCGRSRGPRVGRDVVDRECRLRRRVSADDVHLAVAGTRGAAVAVAESRPRCSLRPRVSGDVVDLERIVAWAPSGGRSCRSRQRRTALRRAPRDRRERRPRVRGRVVRLTVLTMAPSETPPSTYMFSPTCAKA